MVAGRYANMANSWQHLGSEQTDRFQRFLFGQTGSTERDINNADAGFLMEIGDLLHYRVRTAAELERPQREADRVLVGIGILTVGIGTDRGWYRWCRRRHPCAAAAEELHYRRFAEIPGLQKG